jgi:hypothetical protein
MDATDVAAPFSPSGGEFDPDHIDFDEVVKSLDAFQSDDIVKEALAKGMDLRSYSQQIEQDLRGAEADCLGDYISESVELASLHGQIQSCDGILERMQQMLSKFQGDLGTISSEIRHLQDQSMTMNVKLKNRKAAEEKLSQFVKRMLITEDFIHVVCEKDIGPEFEEALRELRGKIDYCQDPYVMASHSARDIIPTISKLRLKACARTRDFFLTKFHALKKPKTNVQIKQTILLKYRYLFHFLALPNASVSQYSEKDPAADIQKELLSSYAEMMAKLYAAQFKQYLSNMHKLMVGSGMSKQDVLGVDAKSTGGFFSTKRTNEQVCKFFELGRRAQVLTDVAKEFIIFHVADHANQKFLYERIFRSAHRLLLDTSISEFDFLVEFLDADAAISSPSPPSSSAHPLQPSSSLSATGETGNGDSDASTPTGDGQGEVKSDPRRQAAVAQAGRLIKAILAPTFAIFEESLDKHISSCYDCTGLLLLTRIVYQHNNTMQKERVGCLDSLFDRMNIKLWTQFKVVFDLHLSSVVNLKPLSLKSAGGTRPHFLSLRYAHFASTIVRLNENYDNDILISNLRRLTVEVDKFLLRCAARVQLPKNQVIFLINNYNLIIKTLEASVPDGCDEINTFVDLAAAQIALYIEEELGDQRLFGRLVKYVGQSESKQGGQGASAGDFKQASEIARDFAAGWKSGVQTLHGAVQQHFHVKLSADQQKLEQSMQDAQAEILKQLLIQLVLYYQRFQGICAGFSSQEASALQQNLISTQTIMYDIKKYT